MWLCVETGGSSDMPDCALWLREEEGVHSCGTGCSANNRHADVLPQEEC